MVQVDLAVGFHSKLANGFVVEGTKGAIRGSVTDFATVEIATGSGGWQSRRGPGPSGWTDFAGVLLRNFAAAVEGREPLLVDPESVAKAAGGGGRDLRGRRQPHAKLLPGVGVVTKPVVLVTGAGGFIGGWVAEALHLSGWDVRAGISRWMSASRIRAVPADDRPVAT